jgi:biopolymer transport protein ExbB
MSSIITTIVLSCLLAVTYAQESSAAGTMSQLVRSADEALAASIAELNELRERIGSEKLPLAQELTLLEQKVSDLRKEHDRIARAADAGNLEIPAIKAEMKVRQDELAYVGNLLDEYVRTFDSKLNVSELQTIGAAIVEAKQASENGELTTAQKLEHQAGFVATTIRRLFEVIGGVRFPGVGVDLEGAVSQGQFALFGPVALFRASSGDAGVVVAQTGSTNPLIRPLEGPIQEGLAALVESGEGKLPVDPSRGGALMALVQKTNLIHIFEKGGPIMWPLLVASMLALATVLERVLFLANEGRKRDLKARERLFAEVERGEIDNAIRISRKSKDYVVRTLSYALEHKEKSLPNALLLAQARELKRFKRGISVLDTVITLSPLLGLLGTVTGMMSSFSLIGGDLGAPGAITGGIAEALIATAFGLGIAIISLLPFNILNARLDAAGQEIESAATQLQLLVHPQPAPVAEYA